MSKDNTLMWILGGAGLLWLVSKMSPASAAAQQVALQNAAALQSQAIATNAQNQNIQTGANLIQNLAQDFTQ
jgi:hypothetical protein